MKIHSIDVKKLIPKDKFDNSTIGMLMQIGEDEMLQILPELLFWIADYNWPIAKEMVPVLIRYPNRITPLIQKALAPSEDDDILKYWIVLKLIPELPTDYQRLLMPDIKRIIEEPTDTEALEELVEPAMELYEKIKSV